MSDEVLGFDEIDRTKGSEVGGKGANLGELARIEGVAVPPGFCVTTAAYRRIVAADPAVREQLDGLAHLAIDDGEGVAARSSDLRRTIEAIALPDDLVAAVEAELAQRGADTAWAVRSSATAEDLPTASFAGQHDSFLNVVGTAEVLGYIRRCWASLFTDRAVTYRVRNGIDHRDVHMAVVVQQLVEPDASGVCFTADPITGNRRVATVEASFGLGEALVSGLVDADRFEVRDGAVIKRAIGAKQHVIEAAPGGGTEPPVDAATAGTAALTDDQAVALVALGRQIEARFGQPQDIEWCLVDGGFQIVQSRPITTLFPIPASADDGEHHVYVSVGHGQMMTDPMKPLGLSVWKLTALPPMHEAAGRLFVDVTMGLAAPATRTGMLRTFAEADPLLGDALQSMVDRGDFLPSLPVDAPGWPARPPAPAPLLTDPAVVTELIAAREASLEALQQEIATKAGPELFDFILTDIGELKRIVFEPRSHQVVLAGMEGSAWLNEHLAAWLGETNAADALTQSVPHNVTSEMGLALLDVADAIRPHPDVVAFLEAAEDDGFIEDLDQVDGGREAGDAIRAFLGTYGMRCVGEIDITRPRWREHPRALLPVILGNVRNFEPGAGPARFEQGRIEAEAKERDVLERLRALPDGEAKADETKAVIDRVRTFAGFREYPKYVIANRHFVYKQALLAEIDRLVEADVLREVDDAFFLSFDELHEAVRTGTADLAAIDERRTAFGTYGSLAPPRVLTSDGEVVTGTYRRAGVPGGALVGLAVSTGTVEGRARVVHDIGDARLEPGDILVTAFTDPSWTPVFVGIAGLVTEVGGLMTHGSVIAREYGLPAVVGVEHATGRIRDGQRIRVDGTDGFVELLG